MPISEDALNLRTALANLPLINGYPETFSILAGEELAIRAAYKPDSVGDPPLEPPTHPVFVSRCLVRNVLTKQVIFDDAPSARIRIFGQLPKSHKGEGASYDCRITLDSTDWPPALYEVVIHDDAGRASSGIYFNIRPHSFGDYDIVCVLPTFTWQAFNSVGGGSFHVNAIGPNVAVSLRRPIPPMDNTWVESSALPFLSAFERAGISFVCINSWDLHNENCPLDSAPVLAFFTLDEYWSAEMRARCDEFVRNGGILLVLAGNICWRRIEVEGTDLVKRDTWFAKGSPEERTFGASFRFSGAAVERALRKPKLDPYVTHLSRSEIKDFRSMQVTDPEHPIFENMNFNQGQSFGGEVPIMYGETAGVPLNHSGSVDEKLYAASGSAVRILATGSAVSRVQRYEGLHKAGVIVEASIGSGTVLHLGSMGWSRALRLKNEPATRIVINAASYCRRLASSRAEKSVRLPKKRVK